MNRSVVYLGVGVILTGIALVSFPIAVTGEEQFDIEQEAGLLVAPVGLVVVMFGASFYDPTRTTVGGAFGNPEELRPGSGRTRPAPRPLALAYHPHDPATCRYCRTYIEYDLANCPRCARSRECRTCGRPLGRVLDRATCPLCARPEAFCNCSRLSQPSAAPSGSRPIRGW